jgi:chromosome segregation protein
MDDVIFAGTEKRAALGRAEVALTIDNTAGVLPIDFSEVTVTRTLFRTGESEYAINGVQCRLLDIQELLSDSGVGRQQHVIISQGQIDAVLNTRPEDRRLIIEEAAGVLKFRRRKERSERRLTATEANLTRLQDLLREVRRQLRPLERQAEDARRHGAVVDELNALRLHAAGKEFRRLGTRLVAGDDSRRLLGQRDREVRAELAKLDTVVLAQEAQLSAMGGDDLGDALVRFESLRERARGLAAVLAERRRGIERDRGASVDQAVVASLEADAAQLTTDLAEIEAAAERLIPEAERLEEADGELAEARQRFAEDWSDGPPTVNGRAAEARGEMVALRAAVERGEGETARARSRRDTSNEKAQRLAAEAERLRAELTEAEQAVAPLAEQVQQAEQARGAAEATQAGAEDERRRADAERHGWVARVEALTLALDEARSRAGTERLADVAGVVGTLLDVVEVDVGWESAFEAAAAEAIAAVVVDDVPAGRRALQALHQADVSGAVLPLGAARKHGLAVPPAVGEPVRRHVRSSRRDVEVLLDQLVGSAVAVVGWRAAVDAVLAHPTTIVVTRDGDRFGPSGWRVGAAGTGATGAALQEATGQAEEAAEASTQAEEAAGVARSELDDTRRAEREAIRRVDQNASRLGAIRNALRRVETDGADTTAELHGLGSHVVELTERVTHDRARLTELEASLSVLEAEEAHALEQQRAMESARSSLDERTAAVAALRRDLEMQAASIDERRQFIRHRLAEIEERLSHHEVERREAEARRIELDRRSVATERLTTMVTYRLSIVEAELASLRERRRRHGEAAQAVAANLDASRKERALAEKTLAEVRERMQRAEIDDAETRLRLEAAVESLRRELDCEPEAAMGAEAPELPEGVTAPERLRELDRELRMMGPINPLALEEFRVLQERHEFLEAQLDDVRSTRRELTKVIRAIDAEIINVFAAAYADVESNFSYLFETLFPGGRGRLTLTEPNDLLATGIEIEAKPSGKNVKKLSLLSGGERSLTALAYLFAVFRARPSPFYVMDEVEAALDDVNLHRFLGLVDEFRAEAQLIIVSHQKRTMEAADCLYGVTMQPGGSSKVISEKVRTSDR